MTTPTPREIARGFAGPDIPALADLQNCIHCGFCLPACPTYVATGQELESPRGRLHLIRGVLDGRVEPTDRLLGHLDLCLQCRACETACPSSVPYGRIMEDARAGIMARGVRARPKPWTLRALLLRHVVARPRTRSFAFALGRAYTRSGAQRAMRGPLRRFLPAAVARIEAQAPVLPRAPYRPQPVLARPAAGVTPRGRVALLTGCIHGELYPQTHEATVRVLARLGFEVVAPPAQACCGALHLHAGDAPAARVLARRNIEAFDAANIDAVIVNAAGCGAAMKEYGRLFRDDGKWAERASRFASRVRDVLEFVAAQDFARGLGRIDADATLQDACHLAHAQGIREAPRAILRAIPGLRLHEMATPDRCCGSAGIYSLTQPAMSRAVLDAKLREIAVTGAAIVATSNPGCTMQIESGARRSGIRLDVRHVIELLDQSYRADGGEPETGAGQRHVLRAP
jgi:glycolate oxidase iron-sulfur subunit